MIFLIIVCFILWLFMLWLTYSKKLNSAHHLIENHNGVLLIRDTPIARLIAGLGVKVAIEEVTEISVTKTHVILATQTGTVDIFINHRFINDILDYLKEALGELEIKDTRPIGKL